MTDVTETSGSEFQSLNAGRRASSPFSLQYQFYPSGCFEAASLGNSLWMKTPPFHGAGPLLIHQLVPTAGTPHARLQSNRPSVTPPCAEQALRTMEIFVLKASGSHSNKYHKGKNTSDLYIMWHFSFLLQHKINSSNKGLFLLHPTSLQSYSTCLMSPHGWPGMETHGPSQHSAQSWPVGQATHREAMDNTVNTTTTNTQTAGGTWQRYWCYCFSKCF